MDDRHCVFGFHGYCAPHFGLCPEVDIVCDELHDVLRKGSNGGIILVGGDNYSSISITLSHEEFEEQLKLRASGVLENTLSQNVDKVRYLVFIRDGKAYGYFGEIPLRLVIESPLEARIMYLECFSRLRSQQKMIEQAIEEAQKVDLSQYLPGPEPGEEPDTAVVMDAFRNELIQRYKAMPYDEYLKTAHWKRLRKEALHQARNQCQGCGKKNVRLEVHHNTYENRGDEGPEDLTVFCRDCHRLHHADKN